MQTDRFHRPSDPALAIFIMRTEDGSHTGLLFRLKDSLIIQDLLWHERFRSGLCREVPHFVILRLEPEQEHDVRMVCALIHDRQNSRDPAKEYRIPYAFKYSNKNMLNRATGEVQMVDGLGMSCSTFVLAVFQSVGITLVHIETWQERTDDVARHEGLLNKMRSGEYGHVPPEHITLVEREKNCMRVRPEEVAATGLYDDVPATYAQLVPAGAWILAEIPRM